MFLARTSRWAVYFLSFAAGRSALFAAPLLLANLLAKAEYGRMETALAVASLLSNAVGLGTAGLLPLILLKHTQRTSLAGIVEHHLAIAACSLLVGLLCWAASLPMTWVVAAVLTAAVALQSLGSTHLKTLGHGEASVLLDAGLLVLMTLAALAAQWLDPAAAMSWVLTAALVYAAGLATHYVRQLSLQPAQERRLVQWWNAVALGWPLMLGGVVSLLATTSGRLGMGLLADPTTTADYAVLSRAAALPIVAHQLILVARFRHLFAMPHRDVERATMWIVLLVAASVTGFWLLSPWLGFLLGPAFVSTWHRYHLPGLWIIAQAVLWSAIALNDLVISRHQVMARVLPLSASFIGVGLLAGAWWLNHVGVSLNHFVVAQSVLMLLYYLVQSATMCIVGVRLFRTWVCAMACHVLMFATAIPLA